MRFIDDEDGAGLAGQIAQGLVEAVIGQHHADIGHDRFGEDAGDIARGECCFERRNIVELDDLGDRGQVMRLADQRRIGLRLAVLQLHIGFIDRTVIAAVEDEDLVAAGDGATPAQDRPVGIGGRCRHLPEGQAEALFQQAADHRGIGRGQHGGEAVGTRLRQNFGDRRRAVAEHRARVAQAEIEIGIAVGIGQVDAARRGDEQRERASPNRPSSAWERRAASFQPSCRPAPPNWGCAAR